MMEDTETDLTWNENTAGDERTQLDMASNRTGHYVPTPSDTRRDTISLVAHALSGTNGVTPKLLIETAKAIAAYIETGE